MTANPQADVATDLRAIEDMAGRLEDRAIDRARDRTFPGGEAMIELGHAGSPETWANRVDGLERHWRDLDLPADKMPNWTEAEDPDELWPALQILWYWSERFRNQLGMYPEEDDPRWQRWRPDDPRWRPTLVSEARFLRNGDVAAWIWDSEPRYDAYAADVARAKTKLETILLEGDRSERTPVICDRCDDGRPLVRVYDERRPILWCCLHCHQTHPAPADECPHCHAQRPLEPCRWHSDPADDRWKCQGCKTKLTPDDVDRALAAQMRRANAREWVNRTQALDLLTSLGHQQRVAARIIDAPETLGWCELQTHIRWISWPDAWRRHLVEMQNRDMRRKRAVTRSA